jgi:hypothetical protein
MNKARIMGLPVLVLSLFSFGCIGGLGMMGGIYTNITSPGALANSSVYQITPDSDFESIAFVEGTSRGRVILGLVATGNFGYGAAIEDALSKAPGATRLIDMTVDTQITSILGVYVETVTKVRGRAIKMRRK